MHLLRCCTVRRGGGKNEWLARRRSKEERLVSPLNLFCRLTRSYCNRLSQLVRISCRRRCWHSPRAAYAGRDWEEWNESYRGSSQERTHTRTGYEHGHHVHRARCAPVPRIALVTSLLRAWTLGSKVQPAAQGPSSNLGGFWFSVNLIPCVPLLSFPSVARPWLSGDPAPPPLAIGWP